MKYAIISTHIMKEKPGFIVGGYHLTNIRQMEDTDPMAISEEEKKKHKNSEIKLRRKDDL